MEIRKKKLLSCISEIFLRKMQNKVYFTEKNTGFFEKNSKFKVKSNWEADTVSKEVEAFGWRVRDKISEMM